MRLGGPVFSTFETPEEWVAAHRALGYAAAFCPVGPEASDDEVTAYVEAAREADLVIAEVGAWSNPVSPIESVRQASLEHCKARLALADRIGARCCVNVSGSRGPQDAEKVTGAGWAAGHPDNLTDATFDLVVASVREIIDNVQPTRTFYCLETMPWMYPDSPQNYLRLIRAIDRDRFAVHLDPVNLICSPQRYYNNAALIRECFETLGPSIKSCHAKDTLLSGTLTVHLDEVRPGVGALDFRVFLTAAEALDPDLPIMLEHLPGEEQYRLAADHLRAVAAEDGVSVKTI